MPFEGIEIAKALSKLPFFPRFFDTSSEQFISLCINESAASYPPDTDIYSHEASTRYLYIVLEGTIQLTRGSRVQTVKLFGIFGET